MNPKKWLGAAVFLALLAAGFLALTRPVSDAGLAPDVQLAAADGIFLLSEKRGQTLVLYFSFVG